MPPGDDRSDTSSDSAAPEGPPSKRLKYSDLEELDTKDKEHEESSGGDSDGDDGSLFDFGAGQSTLPPSVLCSGCRFICDNWSSLQAKEPGRIEFPHCANAITLEVSAKRGCSMC